jgi:prepilin-type N-terminal cleavage/methylation domain-containing protein
MKQKGFSLIELLIVVAIILIIAAIAIPNLLKSRMAANESSAVGTLRTINTSLVTYASTYPDSGFPASLTQMTSPGNDCSAAGLLDPTLANDAFSKSGYDFAYTLTAGSGACPAAVPPVPGGDYTISAGPSVPNKTGIRYFFTDSSAVIYEGTTAAEASGMTNPL